MLSFFFPITVTVVGGIGSAKFWMVTDPAPVGFAGGLSAKLLNVSIKAAAGNPSFDISVLDEDGFCVWCNPEKLSGDSTVSVSSSIPVYPRGSLSILNATADGVYSIKLYCEQSH